MHRFGTICSALLIAGIVGMSCVPDNSAPQEPNTATRREAVSAVPGSATGEVTDDATDDTTDDAIAETLTTDPTGAPAPAGCSTERSCGARKYVCKRPDNARPCGVPGCAEMQFACSGDAACLEGYSCALCKPGDGYPCPFIGGLCRPSKCATDAECKSVNLICQAGACAHKACRRSASCRGYCVSGACWNKPGWCLDTSLPPPP